MVITKMKKSGVILIGIGCAVLFWVFESTLEFFVFNTGNWFKSFFTPTAHETWMRLVPIAFIIAFSVFVQIVMDRQRKMEETLRRSEALYRTIFETTGTATGIVEEDSTVSLVNKDWETAFGFSKEETEGRRKYLDLIPRDQKEKTERYFRWLDGGRRCVPGKYETQILDKTGDIKDVFVNVSVIPSSGKYVVSILDITNLKQIEKALKQSEKRLRLLARRIISAQEEERTRIARELHDQMGQVAAAIKIEAISLSEKLGDSKEGLMAKRIVGLAGQHIDIIHRISFELRPQALDKLGLFKALEWYAEEFEQITNISCMVELKDETVIESKDTAVIAYRILQEALNNVKMHAKASEVKIAVGRHNGQLVISVADDGVGMKPEKIDSESSLGLLGMKERARIIGGTLDITSLPGKGTRITVRLPL